MSGFRSSRVSVFSTTNLAETATITASTSLANAPVSNLLSVGRPFSRWQSADLAASYVIVTMPSVTAGTKLVVYLGNTNFTTVTICADDHNPLIGAHTFQQTYTLSRNTVNWRIQGAFVLPVTWNQPYIFISIPVQTLVPTSAMVADVGYAIGDLWIGAATEVDLLYDISYTTTTPRQLIEADSGAFTEELLMGEPRARLSIGRRARITRVTPGVDDDYERWTEIDRAMYNNGSGLVVPSKNDPTMGFIVRQVGEYGWSRSRLNYLESRMDLDEIVGP